MKVGFIGLGQMGAAMAANLTRAGHEVSVFNRSRGKARALIGLGAREAANVAEACNGEAVITMLADDRALADVALDDAGVLANLPLDATHVSMSTISVELSKNLTRMHAERGQRFIAAPVFGRPEAAAAGKLFIVAGGALEAIARCQPLFAAMGQKTFSIGSEPSAANLIKLSGNFLIASAIEALGEAIALVGKSGIDRETFASLIASSIFPAPAYAVYGDLIAKAKFEPAGFAAPLGFKDVRLVLAAAADLRVPMPLGNLLYDRFQRLLNQGGETLDWSAIGGLAAHDAGDAHRPAANS
jgi:3-hydroxyisobutyrate dehydrogenase-like beta-hydroxyacid dehydrogenase